VNHRKGRWNRPHEAGRFRASGSQSHLLARSHPIISSKSLPANARSRSTTSHARAHGERANHCNREPRAARHRRHGELALEARSGERHRAPATQCTRCAARHARARTQSRGRCPSIPWRARRSARPAIRQSALALARGLRSSASTRLTRDSKQARHAVTACGERPGGEPKSCSHHPMNPLNQQVSRPTRRRATR
jgi:hypothetical protein